MSVVPGSRQIYYMKHTFISRVNRREVQTVGIGVGIEAEAVMYPLVRVEPQEKPR